MFCRSILLACTFIAIASGQLQESDINKIQNDLNSNLPAGLPPINTTAALDQAESMLKKKCLKNANIEAYNNAILAKEDTMNCLKSLIDIEELKKETENAKPTGDLDLVFKKYCGKTPDMKACVAKFTDAVEPCLEEKERASKKIVTNITDSLASFICFKEGDRIALFIAEGGPECLTEKQEEISNCVNKTLGSSVNFDNPSLENIPALVFEAEQCDSLSALQTCVVNSLEKCSEPTPANIAESLFKFIRQVTPCNDIQNQKNSKALGGEKLSGKSAATSMIHTAISSLVLLSGALCLL